MSSAAGSRKPQVEIYRPGSGPLKKSGLYDEEYDKVATQSDSKSGMNKVKREDSGRGTSGVHKLSDYKLSDDFDRLSVSSNRSGKGWKVNQSLFGSTENLSDRRRSRKPEAATQSDSKSGMNKVKREDSGRGTSGVHKLSDYKLSDDFDRLSVSSNRSGKGWKVNPNSFGSTENLSDRRRSRKPEAALYMPPKPLNEMPPSMNQENKTYKSRNYSNSQRIEPSRREDSFRRDVDQIRNDSEPFKREDLYRRAGDKDRSSVAREDDNSRRFRGEDISSQTTDKSRDVRGESEPPSQKPNDRQRKTFRKKPRRQNGKNDKRDENLNNVNGKKGEKITPLMDIKFDYNPLIGERKDSINHNMINYETSGYTTTDGESERDPFCSLRNTMSQSNRSLRQVSEPRSLPLNSVQTENRGRDTRSVEPGEDNSWNQDRFNQKPPPGLYGKRNNSKVTHPKHKQHHHISFDQLPPRLQKKYMEENGFQESPNQCTTYPALSSEKLYYGSNPDCTTDSEASFAGTAPHQPYLLTNTKPSYLGMNTMFIGTNSEDPWDGSSVTFQGTHPNTFYTNVPPPLPNIFSRPPPPLPQMTPSIWSQTLPPARARGRGRVPQHELERDKILFDELRMTRSLTPDALRELERAEGPVSLPPEPFYQAPQEESKINPSNVVSVLPKSPVAEERSSDKDKQLEPQLHSNDNDTASKQSSPVLSKSSQDQSSLKNPSVTSMNWADEVELSERLQETEERESEDNTYSLTNSNISPTSQSGPTLQKDRRKRRKRSSSRDRNNANDRRRSSLDIVVKENTNPRSRKNSENNENRNISRSRKTSEDDNNWRAARHEQYERSRHYLRGGCDSRSNSRQNSLERFKADEYENFNGCERKSRGDSKEPFRKNSIKSSNPSSDNNFSNPARRRGSRDRDLSWERKAELPRQENWRAEARRFNGPGPLNDTKKQQKSAGILVLPQSISSVKETETRTKPADRRNNPGPYTQRHLFDPNNPQRPLIVNTPADGSRGYHPQNAGRHMMSPEGQFAVPIAPPAPLHNRQLLKETEVIDHELKRILMYSSWYENHEEITNMRARLQQILWMLLTSDIKFCEQENLEQHFWKILYYNLLEWLKKQSSMSPQKKESLLKPMLNITDEGMKFFENTLHVLEEAYKFKLDDFLVHGLTPVKSRPHLTMALMSAQKILLFLGDLARYREQVQDTANYGVARQWYIKAQQVNPKNGRPYYQLGVLAVYARRRLDAIYYYMRSLIATIPVTSSRESLVTLFDENRKKFELSEKQRQEERDQRHKERMKEKEFESKKNLQLRREIWIHPEGGRRVHRTTSASQNFDDSEAELEAMPHLDLVKRFNVSFIQVHGKLFNKIGMESFPATGLQMLKELRALLQHSPLPLTSTRLLQLLALNMFAIDNTQLKNSELGPGYRSAIQESALVTSLQMFSLVLERTVQLLRDQMNNTYQLIVSDDVLTLLPAIKVWCDWLLCHSSVWNPPPSCNDFKVGPAGDVWCRLATLVNLLEKLDHQKQLLSATHKEGYEEIKLPEDGALAGFVPLMMNYSEPMFTGKENDKEVAQVSLRIHKILFCCTEFLCGVDPPVLKLQKNENGDNEYISVVETPSPPVQSDSELCIESVSGGESEDSGQASEGEGSNSGVASGSGEIQSLLQRKQELERSHRLQEKRRQKVQNILQSSMVSVEIEVRPHYLVADTNCFIDYLPQLQVIAKASSPSRLHLYQLMVPLVVLSELDGLAHGRRDSSARPEHLAMVTESAALALEFLRCRTSPSVRCVTTKGTILNSATFTLEEDTEDMKNDDKILTTCLRLCHSSLKEEQTEVDQLSSARSLPPGQPRKITREVVLLTEDRNLRVKALARDMPVREVRDFMQWAGLELG